MCACCRVETGIGVGLLCYCVPAFNVGHFSNSFLSVKIFACFLKGKNVFKRDLISEAVIVCLLSRLRAKFTSLANVSDEEIMVVMVTLTLFSEKLTSR